MNKVDAKIFFDNFLLNPRSDKVKNKNIALGLSITVGVCSIGLVHLSVKIISLLKNCYERKSKSPRNIKSQNTNSSQQSLSSILSRSLSKNHTNTDSSNSHSVNTSISKVS